MANCCDGPAAHSVSVPTCHAPGWPLNAAIWPAPVSPSTASSLGTQSPSWSPAAAGGPAVRRLLGGQAGQQGARADPRQARRTFGHASFTPVTVMARLAAARYSARVNCTGTSATAATAVPPRVAATNRHCRTAAAAA